MNRRERRAARARGIAPEMQREAPPGYEETAQAMLRSVRAWLDAGHSAPRFRFPPKEIGLIAPLDVIGHRLALDATAHGFVDWACATGIEIGGEPPTSMMLRVVLEAAGVPVDYVSMSELGLSDAGIS